MTTIRELADRYGDDDEERSVLEAATKRRLDALRAGGGKRCSRCGEKRPLPAFGPDRRTAEGLRPICRPCEAQDARERRSVV